MVSNNQIEQQKQEIKDNNDEIEKKKEIILNKLKSKVEDPTLNGRQKRRARKNLIRFLGNKNDHQQQDKQEIDKSSSSTTLVSKEDDKKEQNTSQNFKELKKRKKDDIEEENKSHQIIDDERKDVVGILKSLPKSTKITMTPPSPSHLLSRNVKDHMLNNRSYRKRFSLFSKFDKGILMDEESWYSVTPEKIAIHIANRCSGNFIIDAFAGAGGNSIQFAKTCQHVISVDLDPTKVQLSANNAEVYGCLDRIDFINADYMDFARSIQGVTHVDTIFLSPPWGGPSYLNSPVTRLSDFTPCGFEIFEASLKITHNIVYFLPRNIDHMDLAKLTAMSRAAGGSDYCEVEENHLNDILKTITVYFGNTIKQSKPNQNEYQNENQEIVNQQQQEEEVVDK